MNRLDCCEMDHEEACRRREFYQGVRITGQKIRMEISKKGLEEEVPEEVLEYIEGLIEASDEEVRDLNGGYDLEYIDQILEENKITPGL